MRKFVIKFRSIPVFLYVLLSYIGSSSLLSNTIVRFSMAILIFSSLIILLFDRKQILNVHRIWYATVICYCFISSSYALNQELSLTSIYTMIITLIICMSFTIFAQKEQDVTFILKSYSWSGLALFFILLFTHNLCIDGRLGSQLFIGANV